MQKHPSPWLPQEDIIKNKNIKERNESPSLDLLLSKTGGSIFLLARVAMVRALEIHFGSPALVDRGLSEKETTIALREIAEGEPIKGLKPARNKPVVNNE